MVRGRGTGIRTPIRPEKNPTKLIAQLAIYGVGALLILRRREQVFELARRHAFLWALLALTAVSALWSDVPGFTLRRSLIVIASTSVGFYIGVRYTMREIIRMICIAGAIAATASLLAVLLWPTVGISGGATDGAWQGIFGQKNTLGAVMSLACITFVDGRDSGKEAPLHRGCCGVFRVGDFLAMMLAPRS